MSVIHTDHYPVEHWLLGIVCKPADGEPPSIILRDTSKPVYYGHGPCRCCRTLAIPFGGSGPLGRIPVTSCLLRFAPVMTAPPCVPSVLACFAMTPVCAVQP